MCTSLVCELEISRSSRPVTGSFHLRKFFGVQPMLRDAHSWLNIYQLFVQLLSRLTIEQAPTKLSFFATAPLTYVLGRQGNSQVCKFCYFQGYAFKCEKARHTGKPTSLIWLP